MFFKLHRVESHFIEDAEGNLHESKSLSWQGLNAKTDGEIGTGVMRINIFWKTVRA